MPHMAIKVIFFRKTLYRFQMRLRAPTTATLDSIRFIKCDEYMYVADITLALASFISLDPRDISKKNLMFLATLSPALLEHSFLLILKIVDGTCAIVWWTAILIDLEYRILGARGKLVLGDGVSRSCPCMIYKGMWMFR